MTPPSQKLLDAVMQLLVAEGYEGVSVRKVATLAGVSIGAVQHHFPTKDAMLAAAMAEASRQFQREIEQRVPWTASAEQALRIICEELLGARPGQRSASVLWVARLARSSIDPPTAAAHSDEWQKLEDALTQLLRAARPRQAPDWAGDQAAYLMALVDGLAMAVLTEPDRMPPDRARRLFGQRLDEVLTSTS